MKIDKYSENWLFENHSKETLRNWVNSLNMFYFKRAWGGHANDSDQFIAFVEIETEEQLIEVANRLGIEMEILPENNPKPIPGKAYNSIEYSKFKTEISNYPKYKQPSYQKIEDVNVHIWVNQQNLMQLSVSGGKDNNRCLVTEIDYYNCAKLETYFKSKLVETKNDQEIEKDIRLISRTVYPELY